MGGNDARVEHHVASAARQLRGCAADGLSRALRVCSAGRSKDYRDAD